MKNLIVHRLLILLMITSIGAVQASESIPDAAESDQMRINRFVNEHYASFIGDYLQVFSDDFDCDYGFVDGPAFDELADRVLLTLTQSIKMVLSERSEQLGLDMTPEQLDYTANLLALSSLEPYVNTYTVAPQPQNDSKEGSCSDRQGENKKIYENLSARLEAISREKI